MDENNFKVFLEKGLPFGDAVDLPFVYNAVTDLGLPDPASWEELEDFIKQQWSPDALPEALKAGRHVWELYIEKRQ